MTIDSSAIVALLSALAAVGTFLMLALRYAKPAAETKLTDQAAFQDRLIKSNKDLSDNMDRFRTDLDECEENRRELEVRYEKDKQDCQRKINELWAEIGRLRNQFGLSGGQ